MPDQYFDPSIALGVQVPPPAPLGGGALDLISSVAGAQKNLVEAQSAAATLAAHKTAGQLIAAAPDLQSGLQAVETNPLTAGFAQDIAQSLAATRQTLDAASGLELSQDTDAMTFLMKTLGANVTNPQGIPDAIRSGMALLPPSVAQRMATPMDSIVKSLTDGLPPDPQGASTELEKRLAAVSTAVGGVSPSDIYAQTGNLPPSLSLQPLGKDNANINVQSGGAMAGPQAPPHLAGTTVPVGVPSPNLAVTAPLSPAEQAAAISKAGNAGPIQADMIADAESIPPMAKRLNIMTDTLGQFQAGGGADARASVAKILQGLKNMGVSGITQEDIDKVGNSNFSATSLFESEVKPLVISELKAAAQGTGRVMNSEVQAFLDSMNDTTDPSALLALMNQAKYTLQIGYDRTTKYLDFERLKAQNDPSVAGMTDGDFYTYYNMNANDKDLPTKTGSGIDLGPTSASNVKGTPQASQKTKNGVTWSLQ